MIHPIQDYQKYILCFIYCATTHRTMATMATTMYNFHESTDIFWQVL